MLAAGKKMAQLVGQQNPKQSGGKRKAREEARGVLVEKREGADKLVKGDRLIVRVSDRKLRARDEATAKRQEEKYAGKDQRLRGGRRRNPRVIPLAREVVAPIDGGRYRRGRILWQWGSHEVISAGTLYILE